VLWLAACQAADEVCHLPEMMGQGIESVAQGDFVAGWRLPSGSFKRVGRVRSLLQSCLQAGAFVASRRFYYWQQRFWFKCSGRWRSGG
jgi:hypothetical protein